MKTIREMMDLVERPMLTEAEVEFVIPDGYIEEYRKIMTERQTMVWALDDMFDEAPMLKGLRDKDKKKFMKIVDKASLAIAKASDKMPR